MFQLRKAHPTEIVPQPPAKDRTYVNVTFSPPSSANTSPPTHLSAGAGPSTSNSMPNSPITNYTPRQSRPMPGMYRDERNASVDSFQSHHSNWSQDTGSPGSPIASSAGIPHPSRLAREKNRLTLRSYLHTLLSSTVFASSPVLRSFLLSGPTRLRYARHTCCDDASNRFLNLLAGRN